MKKKIVILFFICILSLNMVGCISNSSSSTSQVKDSYTYTNEKYDMDGMYFRVYYNSITNIVYLINTDSRGTGITALYNSKGKPMNIDEYNNSDKKSLKNRFIYINNYYYIDGMQYKVYYDSVTNIVYLVNTNSQGTGITVLYDSKGEVMNLDEYNKTQK